MRADRRPHKTKPPIPLAPGGMLRGYELRKLLGQGSCGFVYRVTDREADIDLAVKEYLPHHLARRDASDTVVCHGPDEAEIFAEGLRFFVHEALLLQRLDHPGLVRVHEVWEENGTAYMAMDLSTGRNLTDTRQARWRSPNEPALRHFLHTLLAPLELLHSTELQHRDVAPANIMVEANGHVVLMDLGSPRLVTSTPGTRDSPGPREGYAPPELYPEGEALPRGPWTDIYALGATLHCLVTSKPPLSADMRDDDDHPGHALQRPDQRFSLHLLSVIDWMMALDPQDRPQSVEQLRLALAGREPVPARHAPGRRARWAMSWRRHRHWWWVLPASLLLIGGSVWLLRLWQSGLLRLPK